MKLNTNKYIDNVDKIIKDIVRPEFINILIKPNNSKTSNGCFQLNIILKNIKTRSKTVYSIYINEFNFENKLRTSVIIIDSSSYNYNMLFSNASDTSLEKSYKYISKIVNGGIEKIQRPKTTRYLDKDRKPYDNSETVIDDSLTIHSVDDEEIDYVSQETVTVH